MLKLNSNHSLRASISIIVMSILLSACSPFSLLKTEFEPRKIKVYELKLKRPLYYADKESMIKNSSVNSHLKSFGGEGFIANHKLSKDYQEINPSEILNFTGRIYKYQSSFLERTLGSAKDFHYFYEIKFHSKNFAMPSIIAPWIYNYSSEEKD